MQIPLIGGTGVNKKTSQYESNHMVNALPKAGATPTGQGYITHHPGIVEHIKLGGKSNGVELNLVDGSEWRASGSGIYSNAKLITAYDGNRTSFAFSKLTAAFVDTGIAKFVNEDGTITTFKNWAKGERFENYPDDKYHVNFAPKTYVEIPSFGGQSGFSIQFKTNITDVSVGANNRQHIAFGYGSWTDTETGITYNGTMSSIYLDVTAMAFYYIISIENKTIADAQVKIQDAVMGDQVVSFSSGVKFYSGLTVIGDGDASYSYKNDLTDLIMTGTNGDNRFYTMQTTVKHEDPAPTTTVIENEYQESSTKDGRLIGGWTKNTDQGEPIKSPATEYEFGTIIDACRNRSRYILLNKNNFIISSISTIQDGGTGDNKFSEQRPDELAAMYSAETSIDNNLAVKSWQNYVVVFGRNTTEYFSLTGQASNVYTSQQSMISQCGIIGTHAISGYSESYVCIGSPKNSELGVYYISPSQYQMISDGVTNNILNAYKESELKGAVVESIIMDNDELVYLQLPKETLVYSTANKSWSRLKTGNRNDNYRGIDICNSPELGFTIGDKTTSDVGKLSNELSSQYDQPVEFELYTQYIQIGDGVTPKVIGSLTFNAVTGYENYAKNLWLSYTSDGVTFGNEMVMPYTDKYNYTNRTLINNLGMARGHCGFKIRGQITGCLNISGFTVGGL